MTTGIHRHVLRFSDYSVNGKAAERNRRRQGRDLEFESLHRLGAGFIDRAHGNRMPSRRKIGGVQREFKAVAFDQRAHIRLNAKTYDRRLALHCETARKRAADHRLRRQSFHFKARRQFLHFEYLVDRGRLAAGVGRADAERVLFGQQLEGIQVEFVGRLAVGMDHFAIDDELDLGDLGLPARIDRNDLSLADIFLWRRLKIIRHRRRQGGDLEFLAQPPHVSLDIGDGDIQLMLARLFLDRLDGEGLLSGNDFAIQRHLDTFDVLISANLNRDLRVFGERLVEEAIRQIHQWNGNRRPQCGASGRTLSIRCRDIQREIITRAIGRHFGGHRNDILAAEQKGEVAVNVTKFLGQRRVVKLGIGFRGDRFQEALVDVPAQADRIHRNAVNGRGADALFARMFADATVFAAVAEDDHRFALERRFIR